MNNNERRCQGGLIGSDPREVRMLTPASPTPRDSGLEAPPEQASMFFPVCLSLPSSLTQTLNGWRCPLRL